VFLNSLKRAEGTDLVVFETGKREKKVRLHFLVVVRGFWNHIKAQWRHIEQPKRSVLCLLLTFPSPHQSILTLLFQFITFQFKFILFNYLRQLVYTVLNKFMMMALGYFFLLFFTVLFLDQSSYIFTIVFYCVLKLHDSIIGLRYTNETELKWGLVSVQVHEK